jgi:hypothetical protein
MSAPLHAVYHWSPTSRRKSIVRSGLLPRTPTLVEIFGEPQGPRLLEPSDGFDTAKGICLGTSPSHAWSQCGAIWGEKGEVWDLWQVLLKNSDQTQFMSNPHDGSRLGEIRVINRIPKSRLWHVGSRTVGTRKWLHA